MSQADQKCSQCGSQNCYQDGQLWICPE
ncbi:MAG: hypothetical protein KDD43_15335, partial [Bdellovibrionales bacterium]|nr:hypothetical protein [Bdellovibrionales bacterium]